MVVSDPLKVKTPEIDLAAKQMCMEAGRAVTDMNPDWPASFLETVAPVLLRNGHCWCISGEWGATSHVFCCKCGDRYAVGKEN